MTRTCAQCSAFRATSSVAGCCSAEKLRPDYIQIVVQEKASYCRHQVNGWDIEWKASGLMWLHASIHGSTSRWWLLYRGDQYLGCVSSTRGHTDWATSDAFTGTLAECCRTLVARVKGETNG